MLRLSAREVLTRTVILILPFAKVRKFWRLRIDDLTSLLIALLLMQARAVILLHGVTFVILSGNLAESDKVNLESAADTKLAFDVDGPSHLMNHSVANAQAQPCTSLVNISVFLKLREIHE